MRLFLLVPFIWSTPLLAAFDRPVPQSQSATAELWFGLASLALVAALVLVNHLVMRK
ncbi:MAG: protein NnrT [Sulfitobacter sp.]